MRYEYEIPVESDPQKDCYLGIGRSSWDGITPVIKLGWRDVNGNRSRPGGEFWMEAYLQGLSEAIRLNYITPEQAFQAIMSGVKP